MNNQLELAEATTQAEEVLLGAILIDSCGDGTNEAIKKVSAIVEPKDFRGCIVSDPVERWVWRARFFYAMTKCTLPPHEVNLANKLTELGLLLKHDVQLMAHCVSLVPCSLDYLHYAKAVKDYSIQRQVKYWAEKGNLQKINELTSVKTRKGFEINYEQS